MVCLSTAVCSLLHSLSYTFLEINYSIFVHLLLSAHLFDSFVVHPSVFLSFAPVLISSSTCMGCLFYFSGGTADAYQ